MPKFERPLKMPCHDNCEVDDRNCVEGMLFPEYSLHRRCEGGWEIVKAKIENEAPVKVRVCRLYGIDSIDVYVKDLKNVDMFGDNIATISHGLYHKRK